MSNSFLHLNFLSAMKYSSPSSGSCYRVPLHLQLRINGIKDHGVKSLKQNQHKSFLPAHSQAFAKVMQMEPHAISLKNLNCRRIRYFCSDPNALELVLRSAVIGLSLDLIKYAKKFYLNKYLLMKRLRGKYLLRLGLF